MTDETGQEPMTAEQFWRNRYGATETKNLIRSDNDPLVSIWEFAEAYAAALRAERQSAAQSQHGAARPWPGRGRSAG